MTNCETINFSCFLAGKLKRWFAASIERTGANKCELKYKKTECIDRKTYSGKIYSSINSLQHFKIIIKLMINIRYDYVTFSFNLWLYFKYNKPNRCAFYRIEKYIYKSTYKYYLTSRFAWIENRILSLIWFIFIGLIHTLLVEKYIVSNICRKQV